MYKDLSIMTRCHASQERNACESTTNPGCKWYTGKKVATNNQLILPSPIFEENFCHPATLAAWEA
jgi:hypothetical protein